MVFEGFPKSCLSLKEFLNNIWKNNKLPTELVFISKSISKCLLYMCSSINASDVLTISMYVYVNNILVEIQMYCLEDAWYKHFQKTSLYLG